MNDMMNDLLPPAYVANNEALNWLDRLDKLARSGDDDAIRMFHSITCGMVIRLNELYLDYAQAVLQWPLLLPQDRTQRNAVAKAANEMHIGSVRAGGKGQPDKLGYDSEKGFAIQNLRRVSFARAILRSIKYTSGGDSTTNEPDGVMDAFRAVTEISVIDEKMLSRVRDLPDYSQSTRRQWVNAILIVLDFNPRLVPAQLASRGTTSKFEHAPDGSIKKIREERGGTLGRALLDGLKTVEVVPGIWGD
ncbi:MAG: hypothetical protein WCP35_20235 [Verrucomicrobiota bacterium]